MCFEHAFQFYKHVRNTGVRYFFATSCPEKIHAGYKQEQNGKEHKNKITT